MSVIKIFKTFVFFLKTSSEYYTRYISLNIHFEYSKNLRWRVWAWGVWDAMKLFMVHWRISTTSWRTILQIILSVIRLEIVFVQLVLCICERKEETILMNPKESPLYFPNTLFVALPFFFEWETIILHRRWHYVDHQIFNQKFEKVCYKANILLTY